MATKKIAKKRTLSCAWCKKKRVMYLIDYSELFWWKKYECPSCWTKKVIK